MNTPGNTSWAGNRRSFPTRIAQRVRRRNKVCVQCGGTDNLQVDHIVGVTAARRLGWTDEQTDNESNAQLLCGTCHQTKTNAERAAGLAQRKAAKATPRHPGLIGT